VLDILWNDIFVVVIGNDSVGEKGGGEEEEGGEDCEKHVRDDGARTQARE
jgi:hypothetical protein